MQCLRKVHTRQAARPDGPPGMDSLTQLAHSTSTSLSPHRSVANTRTPCEDDVMMMCNTFCRKNASTKPFAKLTLLPRLHALGTRCTAPHPPRLCTRRVPCWSCKSLHKACARDECPAGRGPTCWSHKARARRVCCSGAGVGKLAQDECPAGGDRPAGVAKAFGNLVHETSALLGGDGLAGVAKALCTRRVPCWRGRTCWSCKCLHKALCTNTSALL